VRPPPLFARGCTQCFARRPRIQSLQETRGIEGWQARRRSTWIGFGSIWLSTESKVALEGALPASPGRAPNLPPTSSIQNPPPPRDICRDYAGKDLLVIGVSLVCKQRTSILLVAAAAELGGGGMHASPCNPQQSETHSAPNHKPPRPTSHPTPTPPGPEGRLRLHVGPHARHRRGGAAGDQGGLPARRLVRCAAGRRSAMGADSGGMAGGGWFGGAAACAAEWIS
jgi:hypothetical protein